MLPFILSVLLAFNSAAPVIITVEEAEQAVVAQIPLFLDQYAAYKKVDRLPSFRQPFVFPTSSRGFKIEKIARDEEEKFDILTKTYHKIKLLESEGNTEKLARTLAKFELQVEGIMVPIKNPRPPSPVHSPVYSPTKDAEARREAAELRRQQELKLQEEEEYERRQEAKDRSNEAAGLN